MVSIGFDAVAGLSGLSFTIKSVLAGRVHRMTRAATPRADLHMLHDAPGGVFIALDEAPVGVGVFLLSQKGFLLSEYTYSTVFYPYSTHFQKLTVFYRIHQERTRIHQNTSMWKSVSAIFIEGARIPQNTAKIPHRVGIL